MTTPKKPATLMTIAARTLAGKPTHAYHFSNEALLLTFALVGKATPPIDRNSLDAGTLKLLSYQEDVNGGLILAGLPYEQRKGICRKLVLSSAALLGAMP